MSYGSKFGAMFALYAYMRLVDDIADEEDGRSIPHRQDELENFRHRTHAAVEGRLASGEDHPVWPAFADYAAKTERTIPIVVLDPIG